MEYSFYSGTHYLYIILGFNPDSKTNIAFRSFCLNKGLTCIGPLPTNGYYPCFGVLVPKVSKIYTHQLLHVLELLKSPQLHVIHNIIVAAKSLYDENDPDYYQEARRQVREILLNQKLGFDFF